MFFNYKAHLIDMFLLGHFNRAHNFGSCFRKYTILMFFGNCFYYLKLVFFVFKGN